MGILSWLLFGLITGVIANLLDTQQSEGGLLGAIVLGIAGAVVGGFVGSLLLGADVTGFNISSFIIAVGGSLLLLFIGRALRRA